MIRLSHTKGRLSLRSERARSASEVGTPVSGRYLRDRRAILLAWSDRIALYDLELREVDRVAFVHDVVDAHAHDRTLHVLTRDGLVTVEGFRALD